jgi:hypothetical protein
LAVQVASTPPVKQVMVRLKQIRDEQSDLNPAGEREKFLGT